MILGRPFLATSNALINCHSGLMKLMFRNMTVDLDIFNLERQPSDPSNQPLDVNLIQRLPSEYFENEYIESNFSYNDQNFEKFFDEEIMLLDELNQMTNHMSSTRWEHGPEPLNFELKS